MTEVAWELDLTSLATEAIRLFSPQLDKTGNVEPETETPEESDGLPRPALRNPRVGWGKRRGPGCGIAIHPRDHAF